MSSTCLEPVPKISTKVWDNQEKVLKFTNHLPVFTVLCIGELLIIVEYCRFGNLQSYLFKNRNNFINQVDEFGDMKTDMTTVDETDDGSDIQQEKETSFSFVQDSNEYVRTYSSTDELNDSDLTHEDASQSISTTDLISWSFQIARGMGYLCSKKVLQYC